MSTARTAVFGHEDFAKWIDDRGSLPDELPDSIAAFQKRAQARAVGLEESTVPTVEQLTPGQREAFEKCCDEIFERCVSKLRLFLQDPEYCKAFGFGTALESED
jgi:hypothetical protein